MFSKQGTPKKEASDDYSHNFFKKYTARANLYTIVGGKKDLRIKGGKIFFTTEKKNFDFFIVVQSADPTNTKDKFLFPVKGDMEMFCEVHNETKTVHFQWNAEGNLKILIEFEILHDDFEDSIKFRNVAIRLIYQVINKRSFTVCDNPDVFDQYCPLKDSTVDTRTPEKVLQAFQKLTQDNSIEFASIGELLSLNPNQVDQKPIVISPHFIFVLKSIGQFEFEIQIYDENSAEPIYKISVTDALKYYINNDVNTMNWLDTKANQTVHLAFKFREDNSAKNLSVIISMALMQAMKKKTFTEIVKDSDWTQYYGDTREEEEEDIATEPEYRDYIQDDRMDVEWSHTNTFTEPTSFQNLNHTNLAQGKQIDRTFVTQENNISVYQAFEDDHIQFICNLPPVKTLSGSALKPRKLMLSEQDTKALMLNNDTGDNHVYYMDIEKGKIISELTGENVKAINDISAYEKNSDLTTNPLLFGCNEKNIFQMDPRVKNSVVAERPYASNYMFSTISGAKDGNLVVGSLDGSIRMYKECGGNAKNVLPSLLGEAILHIDTSHDGAFILATCRSHIMLIPTFQDQKSGFDKTFRKDSKPKPIILKVSPKALAKNNVKELNYTRAVFDNRSTKETLIAADAGQYLILWDLSKVLAGKHDTVNIKSLGDTIVANQFMFNTDKLIAALPHKLVCQSAKISKR